MVDLSRHYLLLRGWAHDFVIRLKDIDQIIDLN